MGGPAEGGSVNITPRDQNQEAGRIKNYYGMQQGQLEDYINRFPLVQAAQTGALDFFKNLPSLTGPLQSLYQNLPAIQPTIQGLQSRFGNLPSGLLNATRY